MTDHILWEVAKILIVLLLGVFALGVVLQPVVIVGQLILKFPVATAIVVILICFIELLVFAFGGIAPSGLDTGPKLLICLSFLAIGVVYYFLFEAMPFLRILVGLGKVVVALVSDWLQLGKYSTDSQGLPWFGRLAFIVGGMFVISSGFKDLSKAMDEKAAEIEAKSGSDRALRTRRSCALFGQCVWIVAAAKDGPEVRARKSAQVALQLSYFI